MNITDEYQFEIDMILEALGIQSALTTDWSTICDFLNPIVDGMDDDEVLYAVNSNNKILDEMSEMFGFSIHDTDKLIDVAKKIRGS